MGKYSIREMEQLSGIKAHTIRIWEKRHNVIEPSRTSTNIRYYSDEDLKKVLNISILNNQGFKISALAQMSTTDLAEKVMEVSNQKHESGTFIDQLIIAMIDLDEAKFEKQLSHLVLKLGFEKTVTHVIYPFLEKIGILWLSGNITPAQEHFISHLIRQKLIVAIDGIPLNNNEKADRVVLYLPEGELHELGLLFFHYIIKSLGFKTYYLGQSVPLADVIDIVRTHQPKYLVTAITASMEDGGVAEYLNRLGQKVRNQTIYVTGYQLRENRPEMPENIIYFHNVMDLKAIFDQINQ